MGDNYFDYKTLNYLGWDRATRLPNSWALRERKLLHLPSLICWTIWLERNKTIFENGPPSTSTATYKVVGIFNSWKEAHSKKIKIHHIKRVMI